MRQGRSNGGHMGPDGCEILFVRLKSDITSETRVRVRETLRPLLDREGHLLLDMRGASVDLRGLSLILSLQRRLELCERRLALVSEEPGFLELVERAGAAGALAVFAHADQALEHLEALRRPIAIQVRPAGQYTEIAATRFA